MSLSDRVVALHRPNTNWNLVFPRQLEVTLDLQALQAIFVTFKKCAVQCTPKVFVFRQKTNVPIWTEFKGVTVEIARILFLNSLSHWQHRVINILVFKIGFSFLILIQPLSLSLKLYLKEDQLLLLS